MTPDNDIYSYELLHNITIAAAHCMCGGNCNFIDYRFD